MYANHRSGFKHPSVPASASQVPHYDESDYVDQQYNGYADEPAPTQAPVHQQRRQGAATQAPQQESKAANGAQGKYPEYFSIKIHGSKAALNFIPDITRKNFLVFGFVSSGLPLGSAITPVPLGFLIDMGYPGLVLPVVAVLLGMGETCKAKFDNHGVQGGPKKGFQLEHQGRHVFFSVYENNKPVRAVPVPLMEAIQVAHMMISIYVENYPGITSDTVMTSLNQAIRKRDMESRKQS